MKYGVFFSDPEIQQHRQERQEMTFQQSEISVNLVRTYRGTPQFKRIHTNLCTGVCVNCCLRNTCRVA